MQAPINSGFGKATTARETLAGIDLAGKVAIVTGGYAGIGLETTRALAEAGATVIVPARNADKARRALAGIARVEQGSFDLLDPGSIDAFAHAFLESGRALDILINNAGIMAAPLTRDSRGYESQFSSNHLGHFQLTLRLWPALQRASGARVVSVSSGGHRRSNVDFEDPNFQRRPYDRWLAYGQSKTANILFALGVNQRGVQAFSVHPGVIWTELARYMTDEERSAWKGPTKSPEQGAATSVWCATNPRLAGKGGEYCMDVDIADRANVMPYAIDPLGAERLWTLSETLTTVHP